MKKQKHLYFLSTEACTKTHLFLGIEVWWAKMCTKNSISKLVSELSLQFSVSQSCGTNTKQQINLLVSLWSYFYLCTYSSYWGFTPGMLDWGRRDTRCTEMHYYFFLFVVQSCLLYMCIFCVNICTFLVVFGSRIHNCFIAGWLQVSKVTGREARNKCVGWKPWEWAEGSLKLHTALGPAEFKGRMHGNHVGTASCAMAVHVQCPGRRELPAPLLKETNWPCK